MPISARVQAQRPIELGLVVHLDQHVHAAASLREPAQLARRRVVERRHDQQDAVGADRARLEHLVGVEDEVLAQAGQGDRRARLPRGAVGALEIALLGQHREAGGAARGIGAREAPAGRNRRGSGPGSAMPS